MGMFKTGKVRGRRSSLAMERSRRDTATRDEVNRLGPARTFSGQSSGPPARSRFSHRSDGPINPHLVVDGVPAQAAPRRE